MCKSSLTSSGLFLRNFFASKTYSYTKGWRDSMFGIKELCSVCQKEIQLNEEVWVRMKYPGKKGMTEIKAFLHQEAQFVCMDCFEETKK